MIGALGVSIREWPDFALQEKRRSLGVMKTFQKDDEEGALALIVHVGPRGESEGDRRRTSARLRDSLLDDYVM
jgi:hypothetical protein